MPSHDPNLLDRAAGALLGGAVGDALGAGYEFETAVLRGRAEMIGGGLGNFAPGEWTDDTTMAVAIAEVAASGRRLTSPTAQAEVGERFLAWGRSNPPDIGVSTQAVLAAASTGADLPAAARAYFERTDRGAGNGALMRTGPVALAHLGDTAALAGAARALAELTHADPTAGDACVLWTLAIDHAVRTGSLLGPKVGLAALPAERREQWSTWLRAADHEDPATFNPNGWTVSALQAAWSSIVAVRSQGAMAAREALQVAIAIGNDTDTVAAICGSLVGAAFGASALELRHVVAVHGPDGSRSGAVLRAHDLRRLAVHAVTGGEDDRAGWPGFPSLLGWYDQNWPADPRVVALEDEPRLLVGNVGGLEDAAADAFVSLCRIGAAQRRAPDHAEVHLIDSASTARNPNLDLVLGDTVALIDQWLRQGRPVFLHCVAGQSRTPAVAALVLAKRLEISGALALDLVRRQVPDAAPNPALLDALERLAP